MKTIIRMLLLIFCVAPIYAQVEMFPERPKGVLSTGINFQMWRWEKSDTKNQYLDPVNQMSFPVRLTVPLTRSVNLSIDHTPAISWWYDDRKISGLSDTWIQGTGVFWNDQMMWNVGMGVPTGKTRLDNSQFDLSRQLSRHALRFRLPVYGQGFCGRLGWAIAIPLREELVFGAGLQYLYRAKYNPVEFTYTVNDVEKVVSNKYNPGDEFDIHLGFDILIDEDTKVMVDGFYSRYSTDYLNDQKVYEAGNKFYLNLAYFHRFREHYLWTQFRYRMKGKNALWQGVDQKGNEVTEGNQFELDAIFEALRFDKSSVLLTGESRVYGKNDAGTGGATIFGFGLSNSIDFWENSKFTINLKYLFGSLYEQVSRKTDGLEISTGVEVGL